MLNYFCKLFELNKTCMVTADVLPKTNSVSSVEDLKRDPGKDKSLKGRD